jgi:Uma2 family endonuclease
VREPEKIRNLTVDEYLRFEESTMLRHEYVRGQIFAMSGSTFAHNVICGNLYAALHGFLKGSGCRVFQNDMKVMVKAADCFYYPDIMVSSSAKSVFQNSPRLIVEVLSPSTKQIDRREKLVAYRQLTSLCQYVLVHQNQTKIEVYVAGADGEWELYSLRAGDDLVLEALPDKQLRLPVAAVYDELTLPPSVAESEEEYEPA